MKFQQTLSSLIGLAVVLTFANGSSIINHNSDVGLMEFMARSNDLLRQDPTRSLDCFNYYIPLINKVAENYESNYKACLNESEAAQTKADDATLDQRNDLASSAKSSCDLLSQCNNDGESVEGIFQCYINGGASNIHIMYDINANASQELAVLRERYYIIKAEEYRCTNITKRAYEKESTQAYDGLNSCIRGISEVPTEGPPTTTTEKTTTQSKPPTESTEPEPETTTVEELETETPPEDYDESNISADDFFI